MNLLPQIPIEQLINILYIVYLMIKDVVTKLFEYTIFLGRPSLAEMYGDAVTILTSLTAIYIILEIFIWGKKAIKIILIIGWILWIVSIVASIII